MLRFVKDNIMTTSDEVNKKYPNSQFLLGNCKLIDGKVMGELLCIGDESADEEMHKYYQDLINEDIPDSVLYKNIGIYDYINRGIEINDERYY